MSKTLEKLQKFDGVKGPALTIVMDGVGLAPDTVSNAVKGAYTPNLDRLMASYPTVSLKAHGTAVGLPSDDDMGNSEVGHNALGAGQVFAQGAKLVSNSIESGKMFTSSTWQELVANVKANASTLHFLGLFSDGNVHSHIDHLKAMVAQAKAEGVATVRIHILLDGRDVGETSALEYVLPFEEYLADLRDDSFDVAIASGGGRMQITMDRYEANWAMVEKGWHTHVLGEGRQFASAKEAIDTLRAETGAIDQDLPPFVIAADGKPVGTVQDGDSVIFFNFRGDRSIEISKAFEAGADFDKFDRVRVPSVLYAGMLEYDGDAHIPSRYLVSPPEISGTMGEFLVNKGVKQLALSETQKYGHVTYFWNGNRSGKVDETLEVYEEIPSDVIPFEQAPAMKSKEITQKMVEAMASGNFDFLRCNFPNGDMVGHTGVMDAVVYAMECVDNGLKAIIEAADKYGYTVLITADHGNADQMTETKKGKTSVRTAHSLNPVPFIIYDKDNDWTILEGSYGLANVAPTVVKMMGLTAPECWEANMV